MGVKVNLMAAVSENFGIGLNGDLPWDLPKEKAYYRRSITTVQDPNKTNVIIAGRATWGDGGPESQSSYQKAIHIIISRTLPLDKYAEYDPPIHVVRDYDAAIQICESLGEAVETVWNIGGQAVYELAMPHPTTHRLYVTKIRRPYECDRFFPSIDPAVWQEIEWDQYGIVQEECDHQYVYCIYEKK